MIKNKHPCSWPIKVGELTLTYQELESWPFPPWAATLRRANLLPCLGNTVALTVPVKVGEIQPRGREVRTAPPPPCTCS